MKLKTDERGVVAIVVSTLIIAIVTLVTLGFSKYMQREYNQSVERQFSTQALYAAESGINDVRQHLADDTLGTTYTKTNCEANTEFSNYTLAPEASLTCLTVDLTPPTLEFSNISTAQATSVPIYPDGGAISEFTISWSNPSTNANTERYTPTNPARSVGELPPKSQWGNATGLLRIDLVPLFTGDTFSDRDSLIANTRTLYLYPVSAASSIPSLDLYSADYKGEMIQANCDNNRTESNIRACAITINGLAGIGDRYYMRMQAIYNDVSVTIKAKYGVDDIAFIGAQAVVDSTGRNADVVRRIKAQVPIDEFKLPLDHGFNSPSNLCKLLRTAPIISGVDQSIDPCTNSAYTPSVLGPEGDAMFTVRRIGNTVRLTNASNNPTTGPNTVTGCSWSATASDNGSIPGGLPRTDNCSMGNDFVVPGGSDCRTLTVTLRMNFTSGSFKKFTQNVSIGSAC